MVLCAVFLGGCAPETKCDEGLHVRILDDVGDDLTGLQVDRLEGYALVELVHTDSDDQQTWSSYMVGACGGDPVEVVAPTDQITRTGVIDQWVATLDYDTKGIEIVTDFGEGPRHELATGVLGCPLPVGGGLAFERNDGTVWFHPDPSDPNIAPRLLFEGSHVTNPDGLTSLDACMRGLGVDDDGLVVHTAEQSVVRVSLDGARQTLIEGPVLSYEVLSNPRYISWLRAEDGYRLIRDRQTGEDRELGSEVDLSGAELGPGRFTAFSDDNWVSFVPPYHNIDHVPTRFVDLSTGEATGYYAGLYFHGSVSPTQLLVSQLDWRTGVFDTETRSVEWTDFPTPNVGRIDAGWLIIERNETGGTRLLLLPNDLGAIEVLAEDLGEGGSILDDGSVVIHDRWGEDPSGALTLVPRDGEPELLAEDVVQKAFARTPGSEDQRELFYAVAGDESENDGLWRVVLP